MSILHEIYLSGTDNIDTDDEGLIWKEILPEGESAYTPSPTGPKKRPLRIALSGESNLPESLIAMQEVVDNFNDGAVENVQIILGDKPGGDHEDITKNNKGFVRKLKIANGKSGKPAIWAGLDITEPDTKDKVNRKTYANVSSGIIGNYINKHTGKKYNAVLKHVAITNTPWVGGMQKFGEQIMASDDNNEDVDEVVALNVDEKVDEIKSDVDNKQEKTKAQIVAERAKNLLAQLGLSKDFEVSEASEDHIIVADKRAKKVLRVALDSDESVVLFEDENKSEDNKEEQNEDNKEGQENETAQEASLSDDTNNTGGNVVSGIDIESLGLNLSDEDKAKLSQAIDSARASDSDELERLRRKNREAEVDRKINGLKEVGLSSQPGVLRYLRDCYIADKGEQTEILLSDDENKTETKNFSVTDLLDGLLDRLKNSEGKINLSDQVLVEEDHGRREATDANSDDFQKELAEANAILGLPVPGENK